MATLQLHKHQDTWRLDGVGEARQKIAVRHARATVRLEDGREFEIRRQRIYRWRFGATASTGDELGSYTQTKLLRAGGRLEFGGQQLELVSLRKNVVHLDLRSGGRSLATAGADRSQVLIETTPAGSLEPGLALFFGWIASQYGAYGNGIFRLIA